MSDINRQFEDLARKQGIIRALNALSRADVPLKDAETVNPMSVRDYGPVHQRQMINFNKQFQPQTPSSLDAIRVIDGNGITVIIPR